MALPLPRRPIGGEVVVANPNNEIDTVAVADRDGRPIVEYDETAQPGFYEVRYAQDAAPLAVAINIDPLEGAVATLEAPALAGAMEGINIAMVDPGDILETVIAEARVGRELWRELMIAALLVFLTEAALAWWFSSRMRRGDVNREDLLPTRGHGPSIGATRAA